MAATATVAFGRYLRMLRERFGLSLEDVVTRAKALPEPIGKGYLSRCENGRQKLAFAKMVTLSRILEVPPEVLVERMELDLELDRIGGPDTEGMEFGELQEKGIEAFRHGRRWEAYALLRDSLLALDSQSVVDRFDAIKRVCIAARNLGKSALTLFELNALLKVGVTNDEKLLDLKVLLAQEYEMNSRMDEAWELAQECAEHADRAGTSRAFGHSCSIMAYLHRCSGDHSRAVALYQESSSHFKKAQLEHDAVGCLTNIAQLYFDQERLSAAKRALLAAERISSEHGFRRHRASIRVLLGEIAQREGRGEEAVGYWRDAIDIAKDIKDDLTWFRAEVQLLRHALETGNESLAGSIERLIRKRSTWVSRDSIDYTELKELLEQRAQGRVSVSQQPS